MQKDTKNLKEVIVLACVGYQGFVEAKADGKVDAADIGHLIPVFQAVGPALSDVKEVIPEIKDLSEAELNEIIVLVQEKVPSLKQKAEVVLRIKAVLKLLVAAKDCYVAFAKPEAA